MALREFVINKGYDDERTVKASDIVTGDVFVDFVDGSGVVLRLRQQQVQSVERADPRD
jgi:hypothetical protein